jgi:hypothetical protein
VRTSRPFYLFIVCCAGAGGLIMLMGAATAGAMLLAFTAGMILDVARERFSSGRRTAATIAASARVDADPLPSEPAPGARPSIDAWMPTGAATEIGSTFRHEAVSGTITEVSGHLLTIQQTARSLVIDDRPAFDARQAGKVAVGRTIVAYGYWRGGDFFATAIY